MPRCLTAKTAQWSARLTSAARRNRRKVTAGHLYVDIEDKDQIAVVDVNTLKVTAKYDLAGKGGGPGGLGLDAKNHILFVMCHEPQTCVILNADDGKILDTLPIGNGTDGGGFNPPRWRRLVRKGATAH